MVRVWVYGVCVFTAMCVHFGWDKCRAQIPSMGHHTLLYVTSKNNNTNKKITFFAYKNDIILSDWMITVMLKHVVTQST